MADFARLALELELQHHRAAVARIEAVLASSGDVVPLKRAAHLMGLEEDAARKRAKRGAGFKRDGQWFFPAEYVDERRRPDVQAKCPVLSR